MDTCDQDNKVSAFWSIRNETLLFNWKDVEVNLLRCHWTSMDNTHPDLFQSMEPHLGRAVGQVRHEQFHSNTENGRMEAWDNCIFRRRHSAAYLFDARVQIIYNERTGLHLVPHDCDSFFDQLES